MRQAIFSMVLILLTTSTVWAQDYALKLENTDVADPAYVRVPQSPDLELQVFTLEAWFMPVGPGAGSAHYGLRQIAGIVLEGSAGDANPPHGRVPYGLFWDSGSARVKACVTTHSNFSYVLVAYDIGVGVPDHVAMTFSGASIKLYVNGRMANEVAVTASHISYYADDFLIGASNFAAGNAHRFDGQMDAIRLWDYVRSEEEIADNMSCNVSGNEVGLVASWDFSGASLVDQTGNGHDGIVVGSGVSMEPGFIDNAYCGLEYRTFRRGDCNSDSIYNAIDVFHLLELVFESNHQVVCMDQCDVNDDGYLSLSDPIILLASLFQNLRLPDPFPSCGVDPTGDMLDCAQPSDCP